MTRDIPIMKKQIMAKDLANMVGGRLAGNGDPLITGVSSLKDADPEQISFLANKKYNSQVRETKAAAVIVGEDYTESPKNGQILIICQNPNIAFSKVIDFFAPPPVEFPPGIHPAAVVADSAQISPDAHIGPCAVIEKNVVIEKGSIVGAGTYVGHFTKIGKNCLIYPNVSIRERCILGNRIIIHSGTTIGSDGFGFEAGKEGIVKIPQVGIVQIDDDVEIGANCTIDRARFGKTWIKRGAKLDNMVHLAHNVVVGEFSMLIGQSGVAGSTEIGRGVIIAAQAGITGHITVGDGAKVAGTAGVSKDVPPGAVVVGTPAEDQRNFIERLTLPKKYKKMALKIEELEKTVAQLKLELEHHNILNNNE